MSSGSSGGFGFGGPGFRHECLEPEPKKSIEAHNPCRRFLPLVSREWKNGSNSSYNCTPFLHSLLTKGKVWVCKALG